MLLLLFMHSNQYFLRSVKSNMNDGASQLNVLGYKLNASGITASDEKIAAVKNFPEPITIKELRQFLGLVNYQRRFIENAAELLSPLQDYLKGKVKNETKISLNCNALQARAGEPEPEPERGAGAGARSHGASQFWRSRSWSRSLFKYFCGAEAGAGATKILLAPAPVMVHRINSIE